MKKRILKIGLLLSMICMLPGLAWSNIWLPDYQATYTIKRDGKPTAEQKSTFKRTADGGYWLQDKTKGTHGLASLSGFERKETSQFYLDDQTLTGIDHSMQQEVAFKTKRFKFNTAVGSDTIEGKHKKKPFSVRTNEKPISSHMIPWWISAMVCQGDQNIALNVMKSNKIKTYHFKVTDEQQNLIQVERVYDAGVQRSTSMWLDKNKNCFPVKTQHQEGDDPVVETVLKKHQFFEQ